MRLFSDHAIIVHHPAFFCFDFQWYLHCAYQHDHTFITPPHPLSHTIHIAAGTPTMETSRAKNWLPQAASDDAVPTASPSVRPRPGTRAPSRVRPPIHIDTGSPTLSTTTEMPTEEPTEEMVPSASPISTTTISPTLAPTEKPVELKVKRNGERINGGAPVHPRTSESPTRPRPSMAHTIAPSSLTPVAWVSGMPSLSHSDRPVESSERSNTDRPVEYLSEKPNENTSTNKPNERTPKDSSSKPVEHTPKDSSNKPNEHTHKKEDSNKPVEQAETTPLAQILSGPEHTLDNVEPLTPARPALDVNSDPSVVIPVLSVPG